MKIFSYLAICKNLIYSDLLIFKQMVVDKVIDIAIWVVITVGVNAYIMPYFGLAQEFGMFQLGGVIAAIGLFELYTTSVDLVSDFEGDCIINYRLTLPIPSWLALLSKAAYFFIIYLILSIAMVPVGKLCLWHQFDLSKVDYIKFAIALIVQSIFYASFSLFAASIIENMTKLGSIWARFIFPMWFMGGFCFSWVALHSVFPTVAWINLINPMIYITESTRVAMIGPEGYLNFWLCIVAIVVFSIICFVWGLHNIKKRLDYV